VIFLYFYYPRELGARLTALCYYDFIRLSILCAFLHRRHLSFLYYFPICCHLKYFYLQDDYFSVWERTDPQQHFVAVCPNFFFDFGGVFLLYFRYVV